MPNSKKLFHAIVERLLVPEENSEKESIAIILLEHFAQLSRAAVMADKEADVDLIELDKAINRINQNEPLQYVLGEAFFYGRKFKVSHSVLIPRPETEELVRHILKSNPSGTSRIADIGTGSGCIALSIASELPNAKIFSIEKSRNAIQIARQNARLLNVPNVEFFELDLLQDIFPVSLVDIIVSNPPYIPLYQKAGMRKNVLNFEPAEALFVSDDDPLIFYRAIALCKKHLAHRGKIWVEINETFGKDVASLFDQRGLTDIRIIKDMNGKDRIVTASKPD